MKQIFEISTKVKKSMESFDLSKVSFINGIIYMSND